MDSICECLDHIGDKVVTTRELHDVRDELDKLELELNYQKDELKALDKECGNLMFSVDKLQKDNKDLKEKEAEDKLQDLTSKLADMDQLHKDCQGKLHEYQGLIKEGMHSDDPDVKAQMKKLLQEAAELEKNLKNLERNKNNIKAAEK